MSYCALTPLFYLTQSLSFRKQSEYKSGIITLVSWLFGVVPGETSESPKYSILFTFHYCQSGAFAITEFVKFISLEVMRRPSVYQSQFV